MKTETAAVSELAKLRTRLADAEAALEAIRSGAADAFIGATGDVFQLTGSENPYVTFFSSMNEGGVSLDSRGAILHGNPRFVSMIGRPIENLRGTSFLSCIAAEYRAQVAELLKGRSTAACEAFLDAPGGPLPIRLSVNTVGIGAQKFSCIVAMDLSERTQAEAGRCEAVALYRRAEDQLRQLDRDLRSILDHVPSMIGYWDKDLRNRFGNHAYQSWFGIDPRQINGKHIREVLGEKNYQLNLPYIQAVLRGEEQVFERDLPAAHGAGFRQALAHYIPDLVEGEVQGFYALVTDITAAKEGAAAVLASEERLRGMYANLQAVTEAERKHVAREVHDELGQVLTALRMESLMLQRELQGQQTPLRRVDDMLLLIESMFKTVRSIAVNLRPSTLDLGLAPAIEWLAENFEMRWRIECALEIDLRETEIDDATATSVFRIIQESLTNVARHAQATSVGISLRQSDTCMLLEIQDNGCGFVHEQGKRSGFGLVGMRERVLEMNGVMTINSSPGKGTCIFIDIPMTVSETR